MTAAEAVSTLAAEIASTPSAAAEAASTTKTTAPTTTAASGSYFISNFELNVDWMKIAQSQLGPEYICHTCSAHFETKLKVGEEPKMIHHGGRVVFFFNTYISGRCSTCNVYWQKSNA